MSQPSTAVSPGARRRVALGLGRTHERRLLEACLSDLRLRVAARCASATELLDQVQEGQADVALLDEDLHLLDAEHLAHLGRRRFPIVLLASDPSADRWQDLPRTTQVLLRASETADVLAALSRAGRGERLPTRPTPTPAGEPEPSSESDGPAPGAHLQLLALFGGPGAPGRTTLATSLAALLGTVAPTILVDLDTTGASVAAQLHCREGIAANVVTLVEAAPDGAAAWERALDRALQPLGPFSPQASLLCGVPRPVLRRALSAGFVERLVVALRRRAAYVLLDLGDEPLSGTGIEARVGAAAVRAADHVLVVATPDPLGLHHARTALLEAADFLDSNRASVLLNQYDARHHYAPGEVELALNLPVAAQLPLDYHAVQRALLAARPVVCDPAARLRRPLSELAERVYGGRVEAPVPTDAPAPRGWGRLHQLAGMAAASLPGVAR